jgi:MoxR-like ATPase
MNQLLLDRKSLVDGVQDAASLIEKLRSNLESVIFGKQDVIGHLIVAVLAEGSVLLEDVPGVGKTTLAKALAASIELQFARVQCTPDLLPSDIVGFSVFQPQDGSFEFRPGPVFSQLLVMDEINRASPRTQSALLEAMAEKQVTIDGHKTPLPAPFIVIATQNPIRFAGTFPLPESQLDRFLFQLTMSYPDFESETGLLLAQARSQPVESIKPIMNQSQLCRLQQMVRDVHVSRPVAEYLVAIASATRIDRRLKLGCSPRGSQWLLRAGQSRALTLARDYLLPDDIMQLAPLALAHRVVANDSTNLDIELNRRIIREIVNTIEVPV